MRRGVALASLAAVCLAMLGSVPAWAHGDEVAVAVEAKAADPSDLLHTDYVISLTFADGDPVNDAVLSATASAGADQVFPLSVESSGNLYTMHFLYPDPGQWTLDLVVDHPDVQVEISLIEQIPLGEAGAQVVRLDTADESRVGSAGSLPIPDHPLAAPPETTTSSSVTSTTVVPSTVPSTPSTSAAPATALAGAPSTTVASLAEPHGAMVQVTTTGVLSLPFELLLRWAHLGAITVWGLAILGLAIRLPHGLLPAASLLGLGATLITGLLLGLWGTPVGYPGIFRWADLGALDYGASWQASFLVKMGGVWFWPSSAPSGQSDGGVGVR